jgi:hypothetical protein
MLSKAIYECPIDLLEWFGENLKSTLDDITPKNISTNYGC